MAEQTNSRSSGKHKDFMEGIKWKMRHAHSYKKYTPKQFTQSLMHREKEEKTGGLPPWLPIQDILVYLCLLIVVVACVWVMIAFAKNYNCTENFEEDGEDESSSTARRHEETT